MSHTLIFGLQSSLFVKKLEIKEFYIVNSLQKKIALKKGGSTARCRNAKTKTVNSIQNKILDVGMQKQIQFWNRDTKSQNHILAISSWPNQHNTTYIMPFYKKKKEMGKQLVTLILIL